MPKRARSKSTGKKRYSKRYKRSSGGYSAKKRHYRRKIKPELNAVDTQVNLFANSTGIVQLLNGVQPGVERFARIGKQVVMRSIECDWYIQTTGTPVLTTNYSEDIVCVMLFLDRQPSAVAPILSDFIEDISAGGTASTIAISNINLNNRRRFKMLMRWEPIMPAYTKAATTGVTSNWGQQIERTQETFRKRYFKRMSMIQRFRGVTNSYFSIETNALLCVVCSFSPAGAEPWVVRCQARYRYSEE